MHWLLFSQSSSPIMKDDLDLYIRARYPLLWVVTAEEPRALKEIDSLAQTQR